MMLETTNGNKGNDGTITKKDFFKEQALDRLGETKINTLGSRMWIISYTNSTDILVQFEGNGYVTKTTYQNFCNGEVKNPYDTSVYGHGHVGVGKYKAKINGKTTIQYITWRDILRRIYDSKFQARNITYKGCSICAEWLNFQVFAKFYDENYYSVEGERVEIDKDLLTRGNKVYSPSTCVFLPHSINSLLVNKQNHRGLLPLGVRLSGNKYVAQCNNGTGKQEYLGTFNTPPEAFSVYKKHKESFIKLTAEKYKNIIPAKAYDALMNYTVSIDD